MKDVDEGAIDDEREQCVQGKLLEG